MKRILLAGLVAGTLMTGGQAMAQPPTDGPPPGPGGHPLFALLDANKDGTVTRAEATAAIERHFDMMDTDHNGIVTAAERRAEHARMAEQHFLAMDTDRNGQVSLEEFRAARERMRGPMPGGPDGAGAPPPPPPPIAGGRGRGWADKHGPEGDVTKADFTARALALFDRIDSNKDGKITAQERDAARAQMKRMRPMEPGGPPPPPPGG